MMQLNKYLIVADDFTGASDTGVQLANMGFNVNVRFAMDDSPEESVVLDTETRNVDRHVAETRLEKLLSASNLSQYSEVIKKVDSTLRGNIAVEIRTIVSKISPELVVFAPALPDVDRWITDGILYVDHVKGMQTDFGDDPLKPIQTDDIRQILQSAFPDRKVQHFPLETLRAPSFSISSSVQYCSFDAQNNEDLRTIVQAAKATQKRVLWVGSAGLTDALLRETMDVKPALALVGSVSDVTRRQLHVAAANGIELINLPVGSIYVAGDYDKYVAKAVQKIKAGKDVVLMSSAAYDRQEMSKTIATLTQHAVSDQEINHVIQTILSGVCRQVMRLTQVSGLFVSGGETAKGLLTISKATGAQILTEIAPGIPLLKVTGGEFDGLHVITKAGAFGDDRLILYSFKKLKSRNHLI